MLKLKEYTQIYDKDMSVDSLKAVIATQPITTGISASDNFSYYSTGIFDDDECAATRINHSVLTVGYGKDSATCTEYFIIKNQWGTSWGENGYMRLKILTADDSTLKETTMANGGYC